METHLPLNSCGVKPAATMVAVLTPLYQNVRGFLPDSTLQPNDFRQKKYVYHIQLIMVRY
jgi:hypothetical protein